eukprot:Rhum_TRINITY_DN11737_c0_g1::Rhum_TRINITY_DN11737_c0_g1_i1::g.46817::m.46817
MDDAEDPGSNSPTRPQPLSQRQMEPLRRESVLRNITSPTVSFGNPAPAAAAAAAGGGASSSIRSPPADARRASLAERRSSVAFHKIDGTMSCALDSVGGRDLGATTSQSMRWMSHGDVMRTLRSASVHHVAGSPKPRDSRRSTLGPSRPVPIGCAPKITLASLYIKDAMSCTEPHVYRDKPGPLRSHWIRQKLFFARWLAILALVLLSFIEEPRWCRGATPWHGDSAVGDATPESKCHMSYEYPSWMMKLLGWRAAQLYEAVCLLFLVADLVLWADVVGLRRFFIWRTRVTHAFVLLVSCVDLLVAAVFGEPSSFRVSPYLRVTYLIFYSPPLRRELTSLLNSVPTLLKVVLLYTGYTVVFAWFGVVIFPDSQEEGWKYFGDFGKGLWSLAVLLTTNNSPDVFIPALERQRLYFFFFFLFLIGGLFFFTNLVIAVVYTGYTEGKEANEVEMMANRDHAIDCAFNCVAVVRNPVTNERVISEAAMTALFLKLSSQYDVSPASHPILFRLLDTSRVGYVSRQDFRRLPGLLNCQLSKVHRVFLEKYAPAVWDSRAFGWLREFMLHVPNFPVIVVNVPYVDIRSCFGLRKALAIEIHVAMRNPSGPVDANESHGFDDTANFILDFDSLPSLKNIANRVRHMLAAEGVAEGWAPTASYVFDEEDLTWGALLSACQLFDSCQIYLAGDDRQPPPPPQYVPTAVPADTFKFATHIREDRISFSMMSESVPPPINTRSDASGSGPHTPVSAEEPLDATVAAEAALDAFKFPVEAAAGIGTGAPTNEKDAGAGAGGGEGGGAGTRTSGGPVLSAMASSLGGTSPKRSTRFMHDAGFRNSAEDGGLESAPLLSTDAEERKNKRLSLLPKPTPTLKWKQLTFVPPSSTYFDLFVDLVVIANGATTIVETWAYLEGQSTRHHRRSWQDAVDYSFIAFFFVEVVLKVAVLGWKRYWDSKQNRFDFFVTAICVTAAGVVLSPNRFNDPQLLKFLVMARMLRLLRILAFSSWYAVFVRTLVGALPKAFEVALLQFVTMFTFATFGVDVFGGKINRDPHSESYHQLVHYNTSYATGDHPWVAVLNFNDMASGFVLLFACLVMNNWNMYVQGFTVTTSKWARCYFEAFWIFGVLGGLNLVMSLLLDHFKEEWDHAREHVEKRIDPEDNLFKSRSDFIAKGYTLNDWLSADKKEAGLGDFVREARDGGWLIDAEELVGGEHGYDGEQYVLNFKGGANDLIPGPDGKPVRANSFIRHQLLCRSSLKDRERDRDRDRDRDSRDSPTGWSSQPSFF